MNILVCVKQVPNTKHMTIDPKTHRLVRHGVSSMINPSDRYALEKALRFRDQYGGKITVISMGAPQAEEVLISAHLVGADRCILLTDAAFAGSDTFATASVLSAAVQYEQQRTGESFDIIFCGRETIDGETGQVGPELAHMLGCPSFPNVSRMDYAGISCRIEYAMDETGFTVDAGFPFLVEFPLRDDAALRSALSARLALVENVKIPRLNFDDLAPWLNREEIGLAGSATHVLRSYVPAIERKGIRITRGTPAQRVDALVRCFIEDAVFEQKNSFAEYEREAELLSENDSRICVFIQQDSSGNCRNISLELLAPAFDICRKTGGKVCAVLIGKNNKTAEQALTGYDVDEIISCEGDVFENLQVMDYADAFGKIVDEYRPEGILIGSTSFGKELAARLAGRCRTGLTAECTGIRYDEESGSIVWSRPAYGGKLMADIVCKDKRPQMGTIREGVFVKPAAKGGNPKIIRMAFQPEGESCVHVLQKCITPMLSARQSNEIPMIVGMGRGIRDMDGFDLCCDFADAIGAEIGASRGCVELQLVSPQYLLGSNGRTVRPRVYFACGISGALQHMTGVNDSECIVAINCDPDADIFKQADYGIVGDMFDILPELQERLEKLIEQ